MTFEHFLILLSSNFKHFGKSRGATASPYVRPCQAPEQNISDLYHGMQRQELYQQLRGPSDTSYFYRNKLVTAVPFQRLQPNQEISSRCLNPFICQNHDFVSVVGIVYQMQFFDKIYEVRVRS